MAPKKDVKGKGKQKEGGHSDGEDEKEVYDTVSEFIDAQIARFEAPLQWPDLDKQDPAYKELKKTLSYIDQTLAGRRALKLHDAAIQAIVEQVEYLRATKASEEIVTRYSVNSDDILIDKDYWLQDLPKEWPKECTASGVSDVKLQRYKKLLKSVRSLDEQYAMLEEKEAFYSSLVAFVKDDDDNPRPAVKNATSKKDKSVEKNGKQGEPAQQKKKKQKQIDQ
ncbi:hypothetical protein EMMF5_000615 [Cystobasidiomycetes sp. EMM_F5]